LQAELWEYRWSNWSCWMKGSGMVSGMVKGAGMIFIVGAFGYVVGKALVVPLIYALRVSW